MERQELEIEKVKLIGRLQALRELKQKLRGKVDPKVLQAIDREIDILEFTLDRIELMELEERAYQ